MENPKYRKVFHSYLRALFNHCFRRCARCLFSDNLLLLVKLQWQWLHFSCSSGPARLNTEETLLQPCIPSWCSFKGRNVFFSSLTVNLNISLQHFVTFPPCFFTKDNADMLLHWQFRELTDWITGSNELSFPLWLWEQWNPLSRLRNRRRKKSTSTGHCYSITTYKTTFVG